MNKIEIIEKKNNSYKDIAEKLLEVDNIVLYPHVNPDGDAIGSSAALALALNKAGKKVGVFYGEELPQNLVFLVKPLEEKSLIIDETEAKKGKVGILIDCGAEDRISWRADIFKETPYKMVIDHHSTSKRIFDMNIIETEAAATAQIVYNIIKNMGIEFDMEIGNDIFAGIATDTGNFSYSNTTKETHMIVAELYDCGITPDKVCSNIYEQQRMEKMRLESQTMENIQILVEGKVAMTYVSQDMLKETGATMDETSIIVPRMRSIKGVELAVLLKEKSNNEIKVSLRSKNYINVAEIASYFGGGGHVRAAGFTYNDSLDNAVNSLKAYIENKVEFTCHKM